MSLNTFFEQFVVFYFRVSDLQRALEFYEGQLGFKRVYVSEEIGWAELSFGTHPSRARRTRPRRVAKVKGFKM